jgi:hypothetical protein
METREILDEQGYRTGETETLYTQPIEGRALIQSCTSTVLRETQGLHIEDGRTLLFENGSCDICETSVCWIEQPITDTYDYVVSNIYRSKHTVRVTLKKVTASE